MELSAVDAGKFAPLLERALRQTPAEEGTLSATVQSSEAYGPLRQIQVRLSREQVDNLVAAYESGAMVYELAKRFGCNRRTVSEHLKRRGIEIRLQPPTIEQTDEMVRLYESGLSLAKVGTELGFDASTVLNRLREHGVSTRDSHGRQRG